MPNEEYLNESLRKIAKGAGIVFIGTGIGMFFAYLGMMIVARLLGPTDFGLISLASAVATIASTVVLVGMPQGVVRYVSFYKGKNDEQRIKGVIVSALKVVLPLCFYQHLFFNPRGIIIRYCIIQLHKLLYDWICLVQFEHLSPANLSCFYYNTILL
jgi:O-antigen/teichoic acid export membrane protein